MSDLNKIGYSNREITDLLIQNFYYTKGNLELISKEMKRGIKGITMKCIQLGLIDKD